jgi:signal transduction histidine kinase
MAIEPDRSLDVLLVEDNPGDAKLISHKLRGDSTGVFDTPALTHVETMDAALDCLQTESMDIVLLDLGLSESTGLETLDRLTGAMAGPDGIDEVPVIVLTGLNDDAKALRAIQRGAQDYLTKGDIDGSVLERSIRHGLARHEQEQELKRQNERLERFASVLSHDLRNPLNVAKGHADILAGTTDHDSVAVIDGALDRMDHLIDDVLAIAKHGESVEATEVVDLASLAEQCWQTVDTADAEIVIDSTAEIEANCSRLQQLFENLVRNAIEHGRSDVTVSVGALPDGFYVEDDGPGIPAAEREAVFEAGFTTNEDGTGFGLNIIDEIAGAHGWQVAVTEGTAGGARFEFTGVQTV